MLLHRALGALLTTAALLAETEATKLATKASKCTPLPKKISWGPCGNTTWVPAEFDSPLLSCATVDVPLDYANCTAGKATLAVIKYKAVVKPKLGSVFSNPGGPGGSGISFLPQSGAVVSNATGGQYDIISWDPRGVGFSTPAVTCIDSPEEVAPYLQTPPFSGFNVQGNLTNANGTDPDEIAMLSQANVTDNTLVQVGAICEKKDGAILPYIGTMATVRDMVSLANVISGANNTINYWGFSYGTVIGAYFVNTFPERVGKVIIDGVVDSVAWTVAPQYEDWHNDIKHTPEIYNEFTRRCAEAGPNCAIAQQNSTSQSIQKWIQDLIDRAYNLPYSSDYNFVTSGSVRNLLFGALYDPLNWSPIATQLSSIDAVARKNSTHRSVHLRSLKPSPIPQNLLEFPLTSRSTVRHSLAAEPNPYTSLFTAVAIACADAVDPGNVTTSDVLGEILFTASNVSQIFATDFFPVFWCHRWPSRAIERFSGSFNHTLKAPVLIISNTYDPVAPLESGKKLAALLGNSAVLLEREAYGHTSSAENSECTVNVVRSFFLNGTYPTAGTLCSATTNPFNVSGTPSDSSSSTIISAQPSPTTSTKPNGASSRIPSIGVATAWFQIIFLLISLARGCHMM